MGNANTGAGISVCVGGIGIGEIVGGTGIDVGSAGVSDAHAIEIVASMNINEITMGKCRYIDASAGEISFD